MLHIATSPGHLLFLTWVPDATAGQPRREDFTDLFARLEELDAVPLHERIFGCREAASAVLADRALAARSGGPRFELPPTWIQGWPCTGDTPVAGIHIIAVRGAETWATVDSGQGPTGIHARCPDGFELLALRDGGRPGSTAAATPSAETRRTLLWLQNTLEGRGWRFDNVFRTWFYLRDILTWYTCFNGVRNELFSEVGLALDDPYAPIPASTGIEGTGRNGAWCTVDTLAARLPDSGATRLQRIINPAQNEAPEYGSAFSRAMALTTAEGPTVFVSGTAAIDDNGSSTNVGCFRGQVNDTLDAVAALLAAGGTDLDGIIQGTAFVKRAEDAPELHRILHERGLDHLPLIVTRADVCRPELLFELDAVATPPTT